MLASSGVLICKIVYGKGKEVDISMLTYGFIDQNEDRALYSIIQQNIAEIVRAKLVTNTGSKDETYESIQRSILKLCERKTQKAPLVRVID